MQPTPSTTPPSIASQSRSWRHVRLGLGLSALMSWPLAHAHEKWFYDASATPLELASLFVFPNALFVLAAVLVTAAAAGLWLARGRRGFLPGFAAFGADPRGQAALYRLLPALLAVYVAVPLFILAVQGRLFSPNNVLPEPWSYLLGTLAIAVSIALLYGLLTRLAALALAALWGAGVVFVGLEAMLENLHYLGFAAFFFLAGRGPLSLDRLLLPRLEPPAALSQHAFTALRVGLGLSLVVAAVTEKLANLPLSRAFLAHYSLNFTAALGFPIPDDLFILGAGMVELVIGLLLVLGLFPRETVLAMWLPFTLTVTVFSWAELVGHLSLYGAMLALLVWEPGVVGARLWTLGMRHSSKVVDPQPETRQPVVSY